MKNIIAAFSIIIFFCSCSSSKDATTTKPEVQEKPVAPRKVNNYPVK